MLSQNDTIADVKSKLENDYSYFGYSNDDYFDSGLESIAQDVMMLYFYQRIGKSAYDTIALKDNVGLTEYETYLYWAEVYTICNEFLKWREAKNGQLQTSSNERLTVEGYTYQIGAGTASSSGDRSLKFYRDKMNSFWSLAGMNIMALERTCNIFGNSDPDTIGPTVINVDGVITTI